MNRKSISCVTVLSSRPFYSQGRIHGFIQQVDCGDMLINKPAVLRLAASKYYRVGDIRERVVHGSMGVVFVGWVDSSRVLRFLQEYWRAFLFLEKWSLAKMLALSFHNYWLIVWSDFMVREKGKKYCIVCIWYIDMFPIQSPTPHLAR